MASKDPERSQEWQRENVSRAVAEERLSWLALHAGEQTSLYVSQAAFKGARATVLNVRALPALFVDLDFYNVPRLEGSSAREVVALVLKENPWLSTPTLFADSGRGAYLIWLLERVLQRGDLDKWQETEASIVHLLRAYGADPAAKDAARHLRVSGSRNPKSGSVVTYQHLGEPISFELLRTSVLAEWVRRQAASQAKRQSSQNRQNHASRGKVRPLLNGYSLAHARMLDLATLAELRAPMHDGRHRMLYAFAQAVSWFCPTQEARERELREFASTYFADPARYMSLAGIGSVLTRAREAKENRTRTWRRGDGTEREVDPRLRFGTPYLMDLLQVTPSEEARLKTIIRPEEKERRRTTRRRAKGQQPRQDWLGAIQDKRALVWDLARKAYPASEIARVLAIPKRSVYRYLEAMPTNER